MVYENFYPAVMRRMAPHIDDALNTYDNGNLTENSLHQMADYVVTKSGMIADPAPFHNDRTLNDIARILILSRLIEESGGGFPVVPLLLYPHLFPRNPRRR